MNMVKVDFLEEQFYNGQKTELICFSCHEHDAVYKITFESPINKQRIPLCKQCLKQVISESAAIL
jgi:hypothetical protein